MNEALIDAQPRLASASRSNLTRTVAAIASILLGIIFLVSGGWKVLSPFQTGELLEQAQVPAGEGAVGAAALGTIELFAAFLLFAPRFRRWGGLLGSALLIFFIGWIAYYYPKLVGHECSCFPLIKRSIGPGFFVSDGLMLLLALAAYFWSVRPPGFSVPIKALAALVLLASTNFAINSLRRQDVQMPNPLVVDGAPKDLTHGKVFLFFYDPECSHCDAASKFMSKLHWGATQIVAIPTHDPQFAADFLHDTHLQAGTSLETARLRKAFPFVDPPYGVALEDGQIKESFGQAQFNEPQPAPELRKLGLVQ